MQLSLLFTALLAFTGMTLAAPIEDVAAAPLPLEKRAYSVCCQTIVGGDLTLGTGTAFNCVTGACSGSGTALSCRIVSGSGQYKEYNLCSRA